MSGNTKLSKGESGALTCSAGDACGTLRVLNRSEKAWIERDRALLAENDRLRRRVSELEAELAEERSPMEIRGDGKEVRKSRWENGFRSIVNVLHGPSHDFEIPEVIDRVRELQANYHPKRKKKRPYVPGVPYIDNLSHLKCLDPRKGDLKGGSLVIVTSVDRLFEWHPESTEPPNDLTVLAPDAEEPGRWVVYER